MRKLIYGVGINDANYVVQTFKEIKDQSSKRKRQLVWSCPYYTKWFSMLERCYSVKYQARQPTYIGCTVCEEWLLFSNFKSWMETQDWEGKQLDKDIINRGNKIYSPLNCVFLSQPVNLFISERTKSRGQYPIGVHFYKRDGNFSASCKNPFTKKKEHLGYYDDPQVAHLVWLERKKTFAKQLAEKETNPLIAKALTHYYENYHE